MERAAEEPRTRRQHRKILDDFMTRLGIVNKHTVIRATEDGGEVQNHDRYDSAPQNSSFHLLHKKS